jgi:hypothetical protein
MKIFIVLFALIFSTTVFAQSAGQKARYSSFKQTAMNEIDDMKSQKTVRVQYNFATHGGAIGTIGLGKYLPAGAIIARSYLYIDTALVSGGTGTFALQCEDANNIKTASYYGGSSAGTLLEGASTGATSAMVKSIGARCEISAVLGVEAFTAGKVTAFVNYVLHD